MVIDGLKKNEMKVDAPFRLFQKVDVLTRSSHHVSNEGNWKSSGVG